MASPADVTPAAARAYIASVAPRLDVTTLQSIYYGLVTRCGASVGVPHEVQAVGRPPTRGVRVDLASLPPEALAWFLGEFRRAAGV